MITNENIKEIIAEAYKKGYVVNDTDIKYAILLNYIEDTNVIERKKKTYFNSNVMRWLTKYISDNYIAKQKKSEDKPQPVKVVEDDSAITFEDNRNALLALLDDLKRDLDAGLIEPKDYYARVSDIRVKLNDKFKVQDDTKDKIVIVEKKYNHICRYGYECYLPTKEDLMEMYDLVERKHKN